jgi:hypothetical protein
VPNDVSTPKATGWNMKGYAAGHRRASVMDWELWEETDSFRFATCIIIQVPVLLPCWLKRMCVGFSIRYGLGVGWLGSGSRGSLRKCPTGSDENHLTNDFGGCLTSKESWMVGTPLSQSQWTSNEPETRRKQMSCQSPQLRGRGLVTPNGTSETEADQFMQYDGKWRRRRGSY